MTTHQSMRQLPSSRRPREKLSMTGCQHLTSPELIAIILGSGTKKENVLSLAQRIMRSFFSLGELSTANVSRLVRLKGIGPAQASKLVACFELGRRVHTHSIPHSILSPADILPEVTDIRNSRREHLVALYLNARHELIKKSTLAIGSLNQTVLEPRDIFAEALLLPCLGVILIHNHPSGDPQPSDEDLSFTQIIAEAGKLLGVNLIDHLIVSQCSYVSMKELGKI